MKEYPRQYIFLGNGMILYYLYDAKSKPSPESESSRFI